VNCQVDNIRKIRTYCTGEDWAHALLWNLERSGDSILLNGAVNPTGFVCFAPIDSRENDFSWTRAWIEGNLPQDTLLRIRCYVCNEEEEREGSFQEQVDALPMRVDPLYAAQELFGPPISDGRDFLIPGSGRFLHLMVELSNTNGADASISMLRVQMQADHMTDYLPAIYQSDDFTYRFLSVFDSLVSDLEQEIDTVSAQLDMEHCSDEMLSYLSSWLCLEEGESPATLRERMETALDDFETMYSVEGIRKTIRRMTGCDPLIIEGKDVNPNNADSGDSDSLRQLYGENPFRFFVLMNEDAFRTHLDRRNLIREMRRYIPAGTEMELVPLRRCVQLGKHTYLGVNTVLQGYSQAAIGENIGIHYDTIIGGNR